MNEHKKPRGNKAKNDKDSILADAKNLLYILHPAIQRMPTHKAMQSHERRLEI